MARRKQLKGIAGNLAQWMLSRNFDNQGYWAMGQFYKFARSKNTKQIEINLLEKSVTPSPANNDFESSINLLLNILKNEIKTKNIPESWLKEVKISFKFETDYEKKYHYWGAKLGGKAFICTVSIATDLSKIYTQTNGCNVWVHSPTMEQRRSEF